MSAAVRLCWFVICLQFRFVAFYLVMIATKEEMVSAKLPLADRDYCAHKLLEYRACRSDVFPFLYKCHHERHEYLTCEYEE